MEAEKIAPPQNTVESIQKELADLAASGNKAIKVMEAYKRNVFKTNSEAVKFMKTPQAREKKMVKWKVRDKCYLVNTPERIKQEKKSHAKYKKMGDWQKSMSIILEVTGVVAVAAFAAFGDNRKKKFLELKLKYVKDLHHGKMASSVSSVPSEKIISILQELAGISYQSAEVQVAGGTDVYIWLFGVKGNGIREDLDLFDVRITIFLKNSNHSKVRHIQFNVFNARRKNRRGVKMRIEFPWKTGSNNPSLIMNRLKRSIKYHPKPSRSIRNLYALTSMPNLRKVLPEVELFLKNLYPQLFKTEDYQDWKTARIKKTLEEVLALKSTLVIPEEKPLAIGVDETSRVMTCLVDSLARWYKQSAKTKPNQR